MTVDLRLNETLLIGDARVCLDRKSGQLARLVIEAPAETRIVQPTPRTGASATRPTQSHGAPNA
jgi:hypothetical protein